VENNNENAWKVHFDTSTELLRISDPYKGNKHEEKEKEVEKIPKKFTLRRKEYNLS
jgi:hypothetical protein